MVETAAQPQGGPSRATFPADRYLLSDIHQVPALADVTPDQALSYFWQMLDNLALLHQTIILDPTASQQRRGSAERTLSSSSTCSQCSNTSTSSIVQGHNTSSSSSLSSAGSAEMSTNSPSSATPAVETLPGMVSPLVMSYQATLRRASNPGTTEALLETPVLKGADPESILEEAAAVASAVINAQECDCQRLASHTHIAHLNEPNSKTSFYNTPPQVALRNSKRQAVSKKELASKNMLIKRFWSRKQPEITVWDYLLRIHHYCPMSTSVYLAASLYIYRLCINLQTFVLTPLSIHRLVLSALRVACKSIEDINFKQARYASVCGITKLDLYRLEVALLFLIDFDICIDAAVLQHHLVVLTELNIQTGKFRHIMKSSLETSDVAVI